MYIYIYASGINDSKLFGINSIDFSIGNSIDMSISLLLDCEHFENRLHSLFSQPQTQRLAHGKLK